MIDTIKSIIDLIVQFVNSIFNFKIELIEGQQISIGIVVVAFVFLVVAIYLIVKALGLKGDD